MEVEVLLLKQMMIHRKIGSKEIASEMGVSSRYVNMILSGSVHTGIANLSRIDKAITRISDRRGGVTKFCCSAADEYRSLLRREVDA